MKPTVQYKRGVFIPSVKMDKKSNISLQLEVSLLDLILSSVQTETHLESSKHNQPQMLISCVYNTKRYKLQHLIT